MQEGVDHIETLLQQSKQFWVKGRVHLFTDNDPIFWMREATMNKKPNLNCKTCDLKFESNKQMQHCSFCGNATCAPCLTQTRFFYGEAML